MLLNFTAFEELAIRNIMRRLSRTLSIGPMIVGLCAIAVAVILGALAGAGPGVIAALAGLLSAALWQLATGLHSRDAALKEQLRADARNFAPPAPASDVAPEAGSKPASYGSAAQYLRPEEGVVSFWPRPELRQLVEWAASAGYFRVQLITGLGGAGKTRLALQLGQELSRNDWRVQWIWRGMEQDAAAALSNSQRRTLLIVDYAETRTELSMLLHNLSGGSGASADIRVLLLARTAGEWWQQLIGSSDHQVSELLAVGQPMVLGPLAEGIGQREVFDQALAAFARKLGVERPNVELTLVDPAAVVLAMHAAALLAVLDNAFSPPPYQSARTGAAALAGLLRHEARYWQQSQAARGLALDPDVQARAVASACLIGADDEGSAATLLATIGDLADSALQRGRVARWLHDLYPTPAAEKEWIGSIQPDLISEQLIVSVLARHPELIAGLFSGLTARRAQRALTVLARAALTDPVGVDHLALALRADLANLIAPAMAVAVETNPTVGDLIERALESEDLPSYTLMQIADGLPRRSIALAGTATVVFRHLADDLLGVQRASALASLSHWLTDLGRPEDALAAMEEAVDTCRTLADEPDAFRPDILAATLHGLSTRLAAMNRQVDALAAIEEATAIHRALVEAMPSPYQSALLADSLANLSRRLVGLGRPEEAMAAIEESVAIYRRVVEVEPDRYRRDLVSSLHELSRQLDAAGRQEGALAVGREAVSIQRQPAQAQPDEYWVALAESLEQQSLRLYFIKRPEEALSAIEEAVNIRRHLAQTRPDEHWAALAKSLGELTIILGDLERWNEALTAIEEAVNIYRQLAQTWPDSFLPELAASLHVMAACQAARQGRPEEALSATEEAVNIRRHLAQTRPEVFRPALAESLNTLAGLLDLLGRHTEAQTIRIEAINLGYRPR